MEPATIWPLGGGRTVAGDFDGEQDTERFQIQASF